MAYVDEKEIEKFLKINHKIEIKFEDDAFFASIPDLPGCFTQADSIAETYEMILDAKRGWIEAALEDGQQIPLPSDEKEFSGKLSLRIPSTLHKNLAELAKKEGVSLNQLILSFISQEYGSKKHKSDFHFHKTTNIAGPVISVGKIEIQESEGLLSAGRLKTYE